MKLRTLAALSVATLAVSFAAPAAAQQLTGLRFETGGSLSGNVGGDLRVGYDLGNITPLIGLSFRNSVDTVYDMDDEELGSLGTTNFILNIEGRYYLREHKKGVSPFIFAGVDFNVTSFGTEDADGEAVNEDQDEFDGDVASDWGINAGFGLEYLFAKNFGVGGKWGLNMTFGGNDKFEDINEPKSSATRWGTAASMYLVWRI